MRHRRQPAGSVTEEIAARIADLDASHADLARTVRRLTPPTSAGVRWTAETRPEDGAVRLGVTNPATGNTAWLTDWF